MRTTTSSRFLLLSFISLALSVIACGTSSGTAGGAAGSCIETENVAGSASVLACFSWTDLTTDEASALCNSGAPVSSCPTTDAVGSCSYSVPTNGAPYTYMETFYAAGGSTCLQIKEGCTSTSGSYTATFSGGC
jgi:hypothetical protein